MTISRHCRAAASRRPVSRVQSSFELRISRINLFIRRVTSHPTIFILTLCRPLDKSVLLRTFDRSNCEFAEKLRINHRSVEMGFGLSSVLFVLLLRLSTHSYPLHEELYEGSQCKLENGNKGICKKIPDCPSRLREVLEGKRSSDSAGRCGFVDRIEIVCCPYNITDRTEIRLRPAEIACRQYENDIGTSDKLRLEDVQFHIFSGTPAEQGEFPYVVALGYENQDQDDDNPEDVSYNCGGTLISSEHVLTAAHCVNNIQEKVPIEVRVGSEDLRSKGDNAQRIPVSDVISHPRYKRSANYHDVAILKLRTPVRMGNNVKPICIQTKSLTTMDMPANVSFVVIGWGITNFDVGPSNKLMKTPGLSIVDRESCAKSFNDFGKLPRGLDESMLCALDTNETRRSDACHGDSGGPLLMLAGPNHSVVGITSFGRACGGPIPGIYTAVYSYLEWIESQVWPETFDETR